MSYEDCTAMVVGAVLVPVFLGLGWWGWQGATPPPPPPEEPAHTVEPPELQAWDWVEDVGHG